MRPRPTSKALLLLLAASATALLCAAAAGRTADAQGVPLCAIYPTLCAPYDGPRPVGPLGLPGYPGAQPVYPPSVLVPAMPFAVRGALDGLPPAVRRSLYPTEVAAAVRSGAVDAAVGRALAGGVVPHLGAVNGYGPGGAGYTNQAAREVLDGTVGPALAACRAMGGCR